MITCCSCFLLLGLVFTDLNYIRVIFKNKTNKKQRKKDRYKHLIQITWTQFRFSKTEANDSKTFTIGCLGLTPEIWTSVLRFFDNIAGGVPAVVGEGYIAVNVVICGQIGHSGKWKSHEHRHSPHATSHENIEKALADSIAVTQEVRYFEGHVFIIITKRRKKQNNNISIAIIVIVM